MSEDIELKLRIAHLSGQINRKEQETSLSTADVGPEHVASYPRGARGKSWYLVDEHHVQLREKP